MKARIVRATRMALVVYTLACVPACDGEYITRRVGEASVRAASAPPHSGSFQFATLIISGVQISPVDPPASQTGADLELVLSDIRFDLRGNSPLTITTVPLNVGRYEVVGLTFGEFSLNVDATPPFELLVCDNGVVQRMRITNPEPLVTFDPPLIFTNEVGAETIDITFDGQGLVDAIVAETDCNSGVPPTLTAELLEPFVSLH